MTSQTYRARWILPVTGSALENGAVTVAAGRIQEIGPWRAKSHDSAIDLGDVVLLPGLVNAHTHLEFSDCERPLGEPGLSLPDWIRLVIGKRHQTTGNPAAAIRRGLAESIRAGVTTLAEIATSAAIRYGDHGLSQLQTYQEVIGFSRARAESVQLDLEDRLVAGSKHTEITQGISPHAPYTVSWPLLKRLVSRAAECQMPIAMHLAESREELQLVRGRTGPFRELLIERSMWDEESIPIGIGFLDYLKLLSGVKRSLVIHGNYLHKSELEFLAQNHKRMTVVYCPRTHAFFGHEVYPLKQMLDQGVRIAFGTDSRASSPDLNLLAELREVVRKHPRVSGEQIIAMATLDGAEALGLARAVGSLTAGKWADMITLPCEREAPLAAILESSSVPKHVLVRGELINLTAH